MSSYLTHQAEIEITHVTAPPTEYEIAELIAILAAYPAAQLTARRLAFQYHFFNGTSAQINNTPTKPRIRGHECSKVTCDELIDPPL
jgi:hypothetical protein